MRKLYIHIGAHKTGTTALQVALYKIRKELSDFSILYDPYGYSLGKYLMSTSPLPHSELEDTKRLFDKKYKICKEEKIILSCEGFFGSFSNGYKDIRKIATDLKYITEDFNIRIIAFVRRQDNFIESVYHQKIKDGFTCTFSQFIKNIDIYLFHWDTLLENYESLFGIERLRVIPYEMVFQDDQNIFDVFLNSLGLDLKIKIDEVPVVNSGYKRNLLEIARLLNYILSKKQVERVRFFLEKMMPRRLNEKFGLFSESQRADLLSYYQESNRNLFKKYISGYDVKNYLN